MDALSCISKSPKLQFPDAKDVMGAVFPSTPNPVLIGSLYDSESKLAVANIMQVKEIIGDICIIVLFARGYKQAGGLSYSFSLIEINQTSF